MKLPNNIRKALSSKNSDLLSWIEILQFFKDHKNELTYWQKRKLYFKSKEMLMYWNADHEYEVEITKPGGSKIKMKNIRQALDIKIHKVNPNDIYKDQTILDNPIRYYFRQFQTSFSQIFSTTATTE